MTHQQKALFYCLDTEHPALFMEMRLGKTLVVIRWAQMMGFRSCLVVAPKAVVQDPWVRELQMEGETFTDLRSLPNKAAMEGNIQDIWATLPGKRQWGLINYEGLTSLCPKRKDKRFSFSRELPSVSQLDLDLLVLDESTRIKAPGTIISQLTTQGFRDVHHRCILSGYPAPEGEMDLFQQFLFLDGEFMRYRNFFQWREKYFQIFGGDYEYTPRPGIEKQVKQVLHQRAFVLTRKQAGIGSRKLYQVRRVEMSPQQRRAYREVLESFSYTNSRGEILDMQYAVEQATHLSRIAGGFGPDLSLLGDGKTRELLSLLVKGELARERVVVFYRFVAELEYDLSVLQRCSSDVWAIHGQMPDPQKSDVLKAASSGKVRILLTTTKSMRYGVDFSWASTAIYRSNEYSSEVRAQSEDRILHPQKTEPLLYIDLITQDTVDEVTLQIVREKKANAQYILRQHLVEAAAAGGKKGRKPSGRTA